MSQERINFEIDPELKSKATKIAEGEDLSLSQYIRRLIRGAVQKTEEETAPTQPAADKEQSPATVQANG